MLINFVKGFKYNEGHRPFIDCHEKQENIYLKKTTSPSIEYYPRAAFLSLLNCNKIHRKYNFESQIIFQLRQPQGGHLLG